MPAALPKLFFEAASVSHHQGDEVTTLSPIYYNR